jgi:hypothetical protein
MIFASGMYCKILLMCDSKLIDQCENWHFWGVDFVRKFVNKRVYVFLVEDF